MDWAQKKERALNHIKNCDQTFDKIPGDKEFAYLMLRILTLELIEELDEITEVLDPSQHPATY